MFQVSMHVHNGGGYRKKLRNTLQSSINVHRVNKQGVSFGGFWRFQIKSSLGSLPAHRGFLCQESLSLEHTLVGIHECPHFCHRCAVDRHPTDININLTILCSDSNGKNSSSARILQIIKGKDYGK